jgi:hypothetical protein
VIGEHEYATNTFRLEFDPRKRPEVNTNQRLEESPQKVSKPLVYVASLGRSLGCHRLSLPLKVVANEPERRTAYTFGISAFDGSVNYKTSAD